MSSGHDIILASSDRVNVNKQQFSSSLSVNFKTLQTCYDSLATPLLSIDLLYTLHCTARAPYSHPSKINLQHHSHKMTLVSIHAQCTYIKLKCIIDKLKWTDILVSQHSTHSLKVKAETMLLEDLLPCLHYSILYKHGL